jgi:hypothetical protein
MVGCEAGPENPLRAPPRPGPSLVPRHHRGTTGTALDGLHGVGDPHGSKVSAWLGAPGSFCG